jgi:hypothetical protein
MKKSIALLLLSLSIPAAHAQHATSATGGIASGSGGTVSYIIGQVFYTTITGSNGSATQVVQQAYETSTVLGVAEQQIKLEILAYPNPTTGYLTLTTGDIELSSLKFELYNSTGKLIESKKIISSSESIRMENLPSATYFLKVLNSSRDVKTFKIIKK